MTEHLRFTGDALQAELSQQPEPDSLGRGSLERIEHNDAATTDAASAEYNFQPEQSSPTHSLESRDAARTGATDEKAQTHKARRQRRQSFLELAAHWSWITIFSILGTLTRLGLQSLNDYAGHLLPPLVWAQFVGCAVMGFVTQDSRLFPKQQQQHQSHSQQHAAVKNDAFYLGITVGYCGSTTSFSAWILQVFQDLANTDGYVRARGYNVISIAAQVMITFAASIAAFRLGNHLAIFTNHYAPIAAPWFRAVPQLSSFVGTACLVGVALACQASTIVVASLRADWRGTVAFAIVFSPAGALTRWYLARTMNRLRPAFPMGTFTANIAGSLLEAIFHLLQYHGNAVGNGNACSLLQGLQDGYCGALTTVSTFVVELCTLRKDHAYIYALTSLGVAGVLYVLVDGIDFWIHGSASGYPLRCTF